MFKSSGYNGGVEFALRDYHPEDFETLWSIDQRCFAPGIAYSRRELATYIRRRGSFTVVAEEVTCDGYGPRIDAGSHVASSCKDSNRDSTLGTIPGILGFIVAEHRRGVGHIISIDVLPASRRLGVGSKLLSSAEERLRAVSCHAVVLETAVDNNSALAFYKRQSYSVVKIVPRYYSNGVDAFVLSKELLAGEGV